MGPVLLSGHVDRSSGRMQTSVKELLEFARRDGYAIGAFNVYNLEGVLAVIRAAEVEASPVVLQVHPASLSNGGIPLLSACLSAAREARIHAAVHLDHSSQESEISATLAAGIHSVMADGSSLSFAENVTFTRQMATLAHSRGACVEAELGRLSGVEDNLDVSNREAKMTDPTLAAEFVAATQVDCLAVCIGNVHGSYVGKPLLDFSRLDAIRKRISIPLVLHGASGLPNELIQRSIALGVAKFNVNTELRHAYLAALRRSMAGENFPELLGVIKSAVAAMQHVVQKKLHMFGSTGRSAFDKDLTPRHSMKME
jgi:tagatose 1,6-diphosphate aldolase GatY/KbaY